MDDAIMNLIRQQSKFNSAVTKKLLGLERRLIKMQFMLNNQLLGLVSFRAIDTDFENSFTPNCEVRFNRTHSFGDDFILAPKDWITPAYLEGDSVTVNTAHGLREFSAHDVKIIKMFDDAK